MLPVFNQRAPNGRWSTLNGVSVAITVLLRLGVEQAWSAFVLRCGPFWLRQVLTMGEAPNRVRPAGDRFGTGMISRLPLPEQAYILVGEWRFRQSPERRDVDLTIDTMCALAVVVACRSFIVLGPEQSAVFDR